jgi:hypothetical protein
MSGVDGIGGVGGVGPVHGRPVQSVQRSESTPAPAGEDRVEISSAAEALSRNQELAEKYTKLAMQLPPVRQDKIDRARELIQQDRLDTPGNFTAALGRMADEAIVMADIEDRIAAAERRLDEAGG